MSQQSRDQTPFEQRASSSQRTRTQMRSVCEAALLFAAYALVFSALGSAMLAYRAEGQTNVITTNDPVGSHYVGSLACAQCHPREHKEWQTSQHAAAMQEATDKTVLGRFDGSTFSHGGVTSTFFKKDGRFWVSTAGPDGELADFEVRYTFGVFPLQQYLVEFPEVDCRRSGLRGTRERKRRAASVGLHSIPIASLRRGIPCIGPGSTKTGTISAPSATRPISRRATTPRRKASTPPGLNSVSAAKPVTAPHPIT